ncbi:MAG TPA: serine hydrolase [Candidatus Saccharimonadales bacterium]|jgi:beta-lactamase class A
MHKKIKAYHLSHRGRQFVRISSIIIPVLAIVLTPIAAATVSAQSSQGDSASASLAADNPVKTADLRYKIDQVIQQNESVGVITSVKIANLQTGQTLVSHDTATSHFAASINKLPVAMLLEQDLRSGKIHLSDKLTWTAADVRAGDGFYDQPGAPLTATVQQLIQDMLNRSGNTAVVVLVNQPLGGAFAVNARLEQYPQLVQTRLMIVGPDQFYLGNTTATESLWVMKQVQKTKDGYEQLMQNAMATNIFTDYGVRSQLAGNSYITLANKVGILDDPTGSGTNRHDVGIIYNSQTHRSYAYSFLTSNFSNSTDLTTQAENSLKQMGLDILRFAGDKPQPGMTPTQTPQNPTQNIQPEAKKVLY